MILARKKQNETLQEQVLFTIEKWIDEGVFPNGSRFPSERELSKRLNVSQCTLQRAITVLERRKKIIRLGPRRRIVISEKGGRISSMIKDTVVFITREIKTELLNKKMGWLYHTTVAAQDYIRNKGNHILIFHPEQIDTSIQQLLDEKPLGFIFPEVHGYSPTEDLINKILSFEIPIVAYGDEPVFGKIDRVVSDHEKGTYELTKFLISLGRKRIIMLVDDRENKYYWQKAKRSGYIKAMQEAGLDVLPEIYESLMVKISEKSDLKKIFDLKTSIYTGFIAEAVLSANPPDAIIVQADELIFAVAAACRRLGKDPYKDILIVGYDNYWEEHPDRLFEDYQPVATVDKLNWEIGEKMAELLYDRITGKLPAEPQVVKIPSKLIITRK
ncbi:MAG TPA: substrate-binding domain-containing protein [Victivallales bacterium]|nr:substrate-binding domain-containing protein [Victivallales bacterium]HPO90292.1 substrate-binding domain-containing protein [Victivallales bacterium]HRU02325.1 substrate-binding domain-containing protein [Victivallales bacterium]